jgi:hypothetical protein
MARTKSKGDQAKVAVRRLLEDEQVQQQLRTGTVRLREAWSRASGRPASKAVNDKKIYSKVRESASSFVTAGKRMRKQPEPPKRGRKLFALLALAGGAAFAAKKTLAEKSKPAPQPYSAPTAAPSPTVDAAGAVPVSAA